jgi:molybdenum cofactor cytidylyltransferase
MPNIGAVILAAGESSRLGQPKQLVQFRGKSLVRRAVVAASKADCSPIAVVIAGDAGENALPNPHLNPLPEGEEKTVSRRDLKNLIVRELKESAIIVENENWRAGIGTSVRAGVQSLIDNTSSLEAIVLLVCDQPFVDTRTIGQLSGLREKTNKPIVASAYSGTLGVPALFDRSCFGELLALSDDTGAKSIILRDRERVAEFSFPEGAIDIDTLADYEKHK